MIVGVPLQPDRLGDLIILVIAGEDGERGVVADAFNVALGLGLDARDKGRVGGVLAASVGQASQQRFQEV